MNVTIEYSAQLKKNVGHASETLELPDGATVQDAVRAIAHREGGAVAEFLLTPEGTLTSSILLCVDDEQVFWTQAAPLRDGAVVTIATPIAGGCGGDERSVGLE